MQSADQTLSPTKVGVGNSGERLSKAEIGQRIRREREREIKNSKQIPVGVGNCETKTSKQIPVVGNSGWRLSKAQLAQRVRRQREREREITHLSMNKQAAAQCTRSGSEKNGVMPQVVPNNELGNMINRFKRAAAEHSRRDMEKRARIGLQTPSSVSSNVPSVVKSHRIQSFGDQASVNVEAANVIGKSLANGSVTEVNKERDKEIVDPVSKAPMVSPLPTTTRYTKVYTSKSALAQRARRERERQARAHLQMPSSIASNGQLGCLPPSRHVVHPNPIQHADDKVASNPGIAKVIGINLATLPVADPNQKQGDKENNASIVETSRVCPIPAKSLGVKVCPSKRTLAQRARREQERQARARMHMSSSVLRDAATETAEHPCPIQPSNPQVTSNVEVDIMAVENSENRAEPKPTEGDIQIISPLVNAPLADTLISKKINMSNRATSQRARREREKQYLLHSLVPYQISSNERSNRAISQRAISQRARREREKQYLLHSLVPYQISSNERSNRAISQRAISQRARREREKQYLLHSQVPSQISSIERLNRATSQRARREREKQYLLHSQVPFQFSSNERSTRFSARERSNNPYLIQASDHQVTFNVEAAKVVGENLTNGSELKQTEGNTETISPLTKAPASSSCKKIYISRRKAAQRARREKEKQDRLHSQLPSQISSNEQPAFFPAKECSNNPCPVQPSDAQVTINVEVAKVVGENLTNGSELRQTEGNTKTISPLAKAPMVSSVPATSSCKKYISKRKAAQRARREKEKQDRLHSQLPSKIPSNEQPALVTAKECPNNPCPVQPSDTQVTINVEVAKVVGENLTNGSELRQTEGNTKTISPLAKAPMVSSVPAASSCKKYISKRKAAQRARREKEKQDRLHSQLPSKIPSNEQPALVTAKECPNNPCPVQPSDTQVTINVEVAKVVGENSANRAEPKQTEGDTDIISPLEKAPMVSPLPAASSSKEINISKRSAAQRARREREKQYLLQSQVPSSSSERSAFFPAPKCSNNPCPNQPSDDQVTINVEVAKVVGENSAIRAEPRQTEGDTDIVSPLVKAPMVSPLTAASSSKEINTSKRIEAQRARREREKQYLLQSQVPSKIYSNEQSTFFPATKCSNNPCPIQSSDTQGTVNAEVAGEINENLVNLPFKDPKQMQGHKEIISPLVKAPIVTPVSDAFFREVINTSKRAATHHAREDKKKLARVELQVPSSASSEKQSVSFTEHSENRCLTQPSNGQATVNLEVSEVGGDDLAERPCPQPMQEKGVKEIISPTLEALRARVASKLLSYSPSDKKRASMRGTEHIEHIPFAQVSNDQVNVNLEVAKVATENSANRQFTEPKQKEGDKELVSPLLNTRIPRPWLQQRPILLSTVASSAQVRPSLRASSHQLIFSSPKQSFDLVPASSHQLRSLPPKQSFSSVRASGHQFRSLLPEQRFASVRASVSSLPPKQSVTPVHASGPKVCAFPPEQKSLSHHKSQRSGL